MNERFETFTLLIAKISRSIRKIKSQELSEYELNSPQISCVYYLYSAGVPLTATELSERCEEDKATVSRSLDYLERNGYISCEEKNARRYKSPFTLTDKGREVGDKINCKIRNVLDEVSRYVSDEERTDFYKSLSAIADTLEGIEKRLDEKPD